MMFGALAGCGTSSDNSVAEKLESVKEDMPAEEDGKDEEKPEKNTENKSEEKKNIEIEEVSWNHSDFGEIYDYNTEIYFKLNTGDVITKEIPFGTAVQGKEMLDIDDDGQDEIVIKQFFANSAGEYSVINIYKLLDVTTYQKNDVYETGEKDVNDLYHLSASEAMELVDIYRSNSGSAIVKPYKYKNRNTYQLIRMDVGR